MHVDGTSKFEEHQTFDIVQEQDQFLTADIRKVSSGNTLAQLNMFVQILQKKLKKLKNVYKIGKIIYQKVVVPLKNTMSDGHIIQKKIFQEF